MHITIPQDLAIYHLLQPAADAAGRSSPYLSLKNAVRAWVVYYIDQGNAATILCTVQQASAVAGTGVKAISATRIWTKLDEASTDYTQQTDAVNFTTDAALKKKIVVFELDPIKALDTANDFDVIRAQTGASNAANISSAFLVIQPRHAGATLPNVLVD